ncbi:MAG: hypothetical protein QOD39_1150 [Mycobacterium sp.]|nr:hypothetical protein [Mycobacterium sp.]
MTETEALRSWADKRGDTLITAAVGARRVDVLVEGKVAGAGLEGLRDAVRIGRAVEVVVRAGGGRARIGTILTRQVLISRELEHKVSARWIEADRDEAIRRWASDLKIEID